MAHTFHFLVEVVLERTTGKFASREAMEDELIAALEGADPSTLYIDESEYEVSYFGVDAYTLPKQGKNASAVSTT